MKRIGIVVGLVVIGLACSKASSAPPEIVQARATVKRLKFAPWDVEMCREYQLAGHKVCRYDLLAHRAQDEQRAEAEDERLKHP